MQLLTFFGVLSHTDTSHRSELQQNSKHFETVYVVLTVGHNFNCWLYSDSMSDERSCTY